MASTFTVLKQVNLGNERLVIYDVSFDGTSAAVAGPFGTVDAAMISPISMNSATSPCVKINTTAASAAANGSIFLSSSTAGDHFYMMVYGKS